MLDDKTRSDQRCHVKVPLVEPLRTMIIKDVGDDAETVITILENTIPVIHGDIYTQLVDSLTPVIDQKAKSLVGKILAYKRKPCRDGDGCKARTCIYLHEGDRIHEDPRKKRRTNDGVEIIFNRVDESKHDPRDLKMYAEQFGDVVAFRRLNVGKYLVGFSTSDSAEKLLQSQGAVLGDVGIKKFYNENVMKADLKRLFDEQDTIMGRMLNDFSLPLLGQLKSVSLKIKSLVLNDTRGEVGEG